MKLENTLIVISKLSHLMEFDIEFKIFMRLFVVRLLSLVYRKMKMLKLCMNMQPHARKCSIQVLSNHTDRFYA